MNTPGTFWVPWPRSGYPGAVWPFLGKPGQEFLYFTGTKQLASRAPVISTSQPRRSLPFQTMPKHILQEPVSGAGSPLPETMCW